MTERKKLRYELRIKCSIKKAQIYKYNLVLNIRTTSQTIIVILRLFYTQV